MLIDGQDGVAPGRWFTLIDAGSGQVLESYDGLTTAEQASGPGGNPKVQREWSGELDVASVGGEFAMETRRLVTLDMNNQEDGAWWSHARAFHLRSGDQRWPTATPRSRRVRRD